MNTDYNGFLPDEPTPIQSLTDDFLSEALKARVYVLDHLTSNPGVLATFDDFEVDFGDIQLETDSETLRDLNETRIIVTQTVKIRRKDPDDTGTSLGRDSRAEARTDHQHSREEQSEAPGLRLLPRDHI